VDENPGTALEDAVGRALVLVDTWLHWDGLPRLSEDGDRIYTPHKAVRRIADHLIDHLAEVEALLAGADTQPDNWHASLLTLESDSARFTESEWDRTHEGHWTLREIADHLTGVLWYAEQVGDLSPLHRPPETTPRR